MLVSDKNAIIILHKKGGNLYVMESRGANK